MISTIDRHPSPRRLLVLAIIAGAAGAGLAAMPTTLPPRRLVDFVRWWGTAGTPEATMAIARLVGVALAGWLVTIASVGLLAALSRSASALRLWARSVPLPLRRALAATTLAAAVSSTGLAGASELQLEQPVLIDLGPARTDTPVAMSPRPLLQLADLGALSATAAPPAVAPAERWTVAPGDHLWRIAEETLRERGSDPATPDIERYWARLIETNRNALGEDVDLIHPGLVLTLPD